MPVVRGPSLLAKILGCPTQCDCDVVIHVNDLDKIKERKCVWSVEDSSFIHRHIWIGGYPHISLEDMEKIKEREVLDVINCIKLKMNFVDF
ncbi:conserved hypothetical protein [Pyrobaculum islandicum DSM 4184]|uniref:Uncharacterized protein n=1 Tax=Pyrobaculum islandicum (strain DSM 4184 / JCM 9189 / GEO3) TaxID=384616 RepID=A1RS03_PYRIL|nr:hypothetical protein [Pyrobaculum islandicum]ABL87735.1 conserved hypothetical protein [Pyrobaculum islandicum DSM 4184]